MEGGIIYGLDVLGAADSDWKLRELAEVWPRGFALGIFDGKETFGDAVPAVRKVLSYMSDPVGMVPAIRFHAGWANHKLTEIDRLKQRLPQYEKFQRDFPGIRVYVSHSCEYEKKYSPESEVRKRVKLVRDLCPSCRVVQSIMPGAFTVPGEIIERHGGKTRAKRGEIVSTDGEALFDIDAKKWIENNAQAEIMFGWGFRFNLSEAGPRILPPHARTAAPSKEYINSVARLFYGSGVAPTPTFQGKVVPIKDPLLLKTHAEDMPNANPRDNLPLVMLKSKTPSIEVVTYTGQPIGKLMYFDTYPGGRFRYYAGLPGGMKMYGWQIADRAQLVSGYPHVWFKQGGTFYGPVHPTFRQGFFR